MLMIGRWSVLTGWRSESTLQVMNGDGESAQRHTLSGRVKFPELRAWRVGMLQGSTISSCILTTRSSNGLRR